MRKRLRLSFKITAMAISMVLVCSICISVFMYGKIKNNFYGLKGMSAQTAASSLAAALDPIEILTLHSTEEENSYYSYLKGVMRTAGRHIDFELLFVLTKAETGSDYKVIYARNGAGDYILELGCLEPVNMLNKTTALVFDTGIDAYSQPYTYKDGRFLITGYSPILDADGNVVAVVGMDISAEDIRENLARIRRTTIIFVTSFVVFFSVISVIYTRRSIGAPVAELSKMSNSIVEGSLDYDAKIKSNDEIGLLYENFKKMQATIRHLLNSLRVLTREHRDGDYDAIINAATFSGAYKSVVLSINDFIENLSTDILEIFTSIKAVSGGNFDTQLAPRPGKKIIANEVFDSVKKTLRSVHLGISVLVKNTADGEFSDGGEVSQYSGDWGPLMRKIVRFHLESERRHQMIIDSMNYAARIQSSLLPKNILFKKSFDDYSVIWKPRDIVGGDIYWLKNFSGGTVLCVCDCTGHGTPGALLTMLVVSALEATVNESNYKDTAGVIWELDQRLISVFSVNASSRGNGKAANVQDGCDIAVLYISKDKSVAISSGHINVFVCNGKESRRVKGQKIFVGEGKLKDKGDVKSIEIAADPDNKFYIASDGLFDQIGGSPARPFGYKRFAEIILSNHEEELSVISDRIWEDFEAHMGKEQRRDDFELITFKP